MDEQKAVETEEAKQLMNLAFDAGIFPSPIDVQTQEARQYDKLGNIRWRHYDHEPKKMRVTNSGHTVLVSAKWNEERPYLSGGPLFGRYVFSQMHFHWGRSDEEGSEHTILGKRFPLEMHIVFFKSHYLTQEAALKELDGMVVAVYLFEIQNEDNHNLDDIIEALAQIRQSCHSCRIRPIPLSNLAPAFSTDYLLYWGSMSTESCSHAVLWMLYHTLLPISKRQMSEFRLLTGISGNLILENWRNAQPFGERLLFHIISPSYPNRTDDKNESGQRGINDSNTSKKCLKTKITGDSDSSECEENFQKSIPYNLASIVAQQSSDSEMSLQGNKDINTNAETIQEHEKNNKNQEQILLLQKVHAFYNIGTKNLKPKIKLIIPKIFEPKSQEVIDIFKKTERIYASTSDEYENETPKIVCMHDYSDDSDNDRKANIKSICPTCSTKTEVGVSKLNKHIFEINDELNHSSWSLSSGDFLSVPTAIKTDGKTINSSFLPSNENFIDPQTSFNFKESIYESNFKVENTTEVMHNTQKSYNTNNDELEQKLTNDFITIFNPQKKLTDHIKIVTENETSCKMPLSDLHTTVGDKNEKRVHSILNTGTEPVHTTKNDENGHKLKASEKLSNLEDENGSTLESVIYHLQKISNLTNEFSQTDNDQVIKFLIYCALRYYILKETPNLHEKFLRNNVEIFGPENHEKNKDGNKNESEKLKICQDNIAEVNNLLHYRNRLKHFMNIIHDNANSLSVNEDELELDSNILGKLLMYYYISNSDSGNLQNHVSDVLSSSNSSSQHEFEKAYNLNLSQRKNKLKNIFKHLTNNSVGIQSIGIDCKNKATQYSNSDLNRFVESRKINQSFSFGNQCSGKHKKIDRNCYTYVIDMNKFEQIRRIRNKEVKHRVFRHFSTNSLVLGRNTDQINRLYKSLMLKLGGTEKKHEISHEKQYFKNINQQRHLAKNAKPFHSHADNDNVKSHFKKAKHSEKIDQFNVDNTKRWKELKSNVKEHTPKQGCSIHNPMKGIKVNKFLVSTTMTPMMRIDKQAGNCNILKAPLHQCVTDKNTDSNYSLFHHIKQILNWNPKEI